MECHHFANKSYLFPTCYASLPFSVSEYILVWQFEVLISGCCFCQSGYLIMMLPNTVKEIKLHVIVGWVLLIIQYQINSWFLLLYPFFKVFDTFQNFPKPSLSLTLCWYTYIHLSSLEAVSLLPSF
ncbi:hypothetical protein VNO78_13040 [Psophocarpus tetragonolobus]|uniref:Uncharacterized protein n=1 Tax=Psophocarpus tetragonolobus TaxID=3891 RepID=A0AAN9SRJ4_PSOTE